MSLLKLHIGCADKKLDGFINIDVRKTNATDIVAPAWDISDIKNNSVDVIYTRHMLEHLDPNDARLALNHWFDLLKDDGILHLIVPDIEFHAKQLLGLVKANRFENQVEHAFAGFWGWRDETRGGSREDAHKWGYTQNTLFEELKKAEFDAFARINQGKDSEPWHLNIVATKTAEKLKSLFS